jgi:hypothetical protein
MLIVCFIYIIQFYFYSECDDGILFTNANDVFDISAGELESPDQVVDGSLTLPAGETIELSPVRIVIVSNTF